MMRWAQGEKALKYYEDGEHCTQNYLDEVFPELIDWIKKKLVNHGKPNPLFPVSGVQKPFNEAASSNKTIKLWDDGNHGVTNHIIEVITRVTDWFAEILHEVQSISNKS
jgi:hypothetical protein